MYNFQTPSICEPVPCEYAPMPVQVQATCVHPRLVTGELLLILDVPDQDAPAPSNAHPIVPFVLIPSHQPPFALAQLYPFCIILPHQYPSELSVLASIQSATVNGVSKLKLKSSVS